jgi:hypothetical protein
MQALVHCMDYNSSFAADLSAPYIIFKKNT